MAFFKKKLPITAMALELLPQVFQSDTKAAILEIATQGGFKPEEIEPLSRHVFGLTLALWYGHAAFQATRDLNSSGAYESFTIGVLGSYKKFEMTDEDAWRRTERTMGVIDQYVGAWQECDPKFRPPDKEWPFHFCSYFADLAAPVGTHEGADLLRRAIALDIAWQSHSRIEGEIAKIRREWRITL